MVEIFPPVLPQKPHLNENKTVFRKTLNYDKKIW